jgi:hypothetical protein
MKKSILIITGLCLVLFTASSFAMKMDAGVKGGLSLSNLMGKGVEFADTSMDPSMRMGFTGYGFFGVDFTDNIGAQIELGYAQKGKSYAFKTESKNTVALNFDYLEIPILVKGMYPVGDLKPMIYVGPTMGFMLASNEKMHMEAPVSMDTTITIEDSTRNGFEFGLAFGVGTTYKVGPGAILLDIRYTLGLTTIPKLSDADKAAGAKEADVEMKTGTLGFMVGYQMDF